MIKRDTYFETQPKSVWQVKLKAGQSEGRALAAYDESGDSISWDRTWFDDGILYVDFGVDEHTGKLVYEYRDETQSNVIEGNGGTISFTVNQFNGGVATDPVRFQ